MPLSIVIPLLFLLCVNGLQDVRDILASQWIVKITNTVGCFNLSTLFNGSQYVIRFQVVSIAFLRCASTMAEYGGIVAALGSSENEPWTVKNGRMDSVAVQQRCTETASFGGPRVYGAVNSTD